MSNITMIQGMNLIEYSKFIANSNLVPKEYRSKPADIAIVIDMGMEFGLKPFQALQNIACINGKPSIWGDAALAVVKAHPAFEDIEETYNADKTVFTCKIKRKGQTLVERSFSVDNAKKAKLWGKMGPWTDYPERMLQMRARGFAMRDAFPDALKGLILAEEAQDYSTEIKDITPQTSKAESLMNKITQLVPEVAIDASNDQNERQEYKKLLTEICALLARYPEANEKVDSFLKRKDLESIESMTAEELSNTIEWIRGKYENQQ